MARIAMVVLIGCVFPFLPRAQKVDKPIGNYYWLDASPACGPGRFGGDISLSLNFDKLVMTGQVQELVTNEFLCWSCEAPNELRTVNLLVGRITKFKHFYLTNSMGVGLGQGIEPTVVGETGGWLSTPIYDYTYSTVPSLVGEVKAGLPVLKVYAVHIKAGFSLNAVAPSVYIGVGMGMGKFF